MRRDDGMAAASLVMIGVLVCVGGVALSSETPSVEERGADGVNGACGKGEPVAVVCRHRAMATEFTFRIYTDPAKKSESEVQRIAREAFEAVDNLEARVSRWRPDSQTTQINNQAATRPVRVAPDVFGLVRTCERIHGETRGAFDITVGPLIRLWGRCRDEGRLPTQEELAQARALVGFDLVRTNPDERTVSYGKQGVMIDFGGIAKGLALDRAAEVLAQYGITSALLNGGRSTVVAIGTPPGKAGWTVRIRNPYNIEESVDELVLRDACFSSSSNYERTFEVAGEQYGHIFDPRTGWPVDELAVAAAIAPSGALSDALSTAFFVLGEAGTRQYCDEHPEVGAVLAPVSEDGRPEAIRISVNAE